MTDEFSINGQTVAPGSRAMVDIKLPMLYTHDHLTMPVHVIRGRKSGPVLFVSAAIHGDELNGIEIIRRLLQLKRLSKLRGTLIAVPIVNVYGVIHQSRYLPDRRDLNRSFPGQDHGSMSARLANLFMTQIVSQCTHGIDLHTGAIHRGNFPQIRANLDDAETERLARAFGVPVLLNSTLRDGSLRESAAEMGIPMLLYEAGEALRFDELSIRAGLRGVINVMRELHMLPPGKSRRKPLAEPFVARSSNWVRAPESGILRTLVRLGEHVKCGDLMGIISDPYGQRNYQILAPTSGVVIGRSNIPLIHEGEALFHVARYEASHDVADHVEAFQAEYEDMQQPETIV
ncbi:MAG: succinylglutamate desuccinylase/aspartoacylase family protein [Gammaproteobacteria bacterium]|jgi:predicted deacylase|nr:succinylglutamate desuccinylase/aspartoacylase family protein [Gammaproteobacteria bacterium]